MTSSSHDPVHHPSHYTSGAVECIDAIEAALGPEGFIAFLRGQVIRYNWRLGKKDAPAQEAGKAKWYMDLLEKRLKEQDKNPFGDDEWPTSDEPVAQSIQGAALTDKKEIQNGTIIDNRIYGSAEYLRTRGIHDSNHCRSSDIPGFWFAGVRFLTGS